MSGVIPSVDYNHPHQVYRAKERIDIEVPPVQTTPPPPPPAGPSA